MKSSVFEPLQQTPHVYTHFPNIFSTFLFVYVSSESASIEINPSDNHRYHFSCFVHFFTVNRREKRRKKTTQRKQQNWSILILFYHICLSIEIERNETRKEKRKEKRTYSQSQRALVFFPSIELSFCTHTHYKLLTKIRIPKIVWKVVFFLRSKEEKIPCDKQTIQQKFINTYSSSVSTHKKRVSSIHVPIISWCAFVYHWMCHRFFDSRWPCVIPTYKKWR